jgi:hypothetical protein
MKSKAGLSYILGRGSGRNYTSLCICDIHAGDPTISIPVGVHVGSSAALINA